ncbi:hypothetical protein LEP1GSC127_1606 [Leptospira kirschneri str. 200801925]|nr:hypothetical protein LEP1GSC127_1606 [Leptospira kirschneri str. 200801925]
MSWYKNFNSLKKLVPISEKVIEPKSQSQPGDSSEFDS